MYRFALVPMGQLRLKGLAHVLGRVNVGAAAQYDAVDQGQAGDPLGERASNDHRDNRAQRMPQQGKLLPAQLLGDTQHVKRVIGQRITRPTRAVIRVAVTGEVHSHNAQPRKFGSQPGKAIGVIQPAMQGDDRQPVLRAKYMRCQLDMWQAQTDFFNHRAHAGCSLEAGLTQFPAGKNVFEQMGGFLRLLQREHVPARHAQRLTEGQTRHGAGMMAHDHAAVLPTHHG